MSRSPVVEFRFEAPPSERDRLVAELFALGTLGLLENDLGFAVYFARGASAEGAWRAVTDLADPARHVRVEGPLEVPATDWEREWRRGLRPREIAGLWIRPSWCESRGEPELCIDPEQAFGSGEHATTRIALRLLLESLRPGDRVLDVGTGSGVLALAALRCGAGSALACDLDAAACGNAAANAARNRLRLPLFVGTLDALRASARVELCAANLLWGELRPWLPRVAAHAGRGLVVAGALEAERAPVVAAARVQGLEPVRELRESQSGDLWWGACFERPATR